MGRAPVSRAAAARTPPAGAAPAAPPPLPPPALPPQSGPRSGRFSAIIVVAGCRAGCGACWAGEWAQAAAVAAARARAGTNDRFITGCTARDEKNARQNQRQVEPGTKARISYRTHDRREVLYFLSSRFRTPGGLYHSFCLTVDARLATGPDIGLALESCPAPPEAMLDTPVTS